MDITLPTFKDERGLLIVWDRDIPFDVKRIFWIYNVPEGYTRAGHQHKVCKQAIFAIAGSFKVNKYLLDNPAQGLYIPAGTFITLHHFSTDAVALVLCSEHYEISEFETE